MHTIYFYSGVGGFFVGTALALLGLPGLLLTLLLTVVGCGVFVVYQLNETDPVVATVAIVLICAAVGAARTGIATAQNNEQRHVFAAAVNEQVTVEGLVVNRPAQTQTGQNFTIRIHQLEPETADKQLTGTSKAVVYAGAFPQLSYGDRVRLVGRLQKPEVFASEGGREFPYPQYLARNDIFYEFSQPTVTKLAEGQGGWLKQPLANLRTSLLTALHKHIPDPHAALTGGVLLGAEDALGESLQEDFRQTSLIHIVVLSGFNVMVVATAIGEGLLAVGLPLMLSASAATVGIILFALLVGLTPTVVRASIMAIFALLARVSGRGYAAGRGLALAAVGMVLVTPEILLYDPSFQLSAVATAGLITVGDQVEAQLRWLPKQLGIREAATATISAQVAVLPLLLYYTGTLSLVSLPANLLVLPVVPVLMTVGALTAGLGKLFAGLAFVPAAGSYLVSEYVFRAVESLSGLSFATVAIPPFSILLVISVYVGGIILYLKYKRKEQEFQQLPAPKN